MNGRQEREQVEARADLILADRVSAEAYGRYFEAQLRHGGRIRRLLRSCGRLVVLVLESLAVLDPWGEDW